MLGALVKLHFSSVPEWVIIVIVAVIFSILKYLLTVSYTHLTLPTNSRV